MAYSLRTITQKGSSVFSTSHYPRWMLDFLENTPPAMQCLRNACNFLKQYWRELHTSSHIRYVHEMRVLVIINGIAYQSIRLTAEKPIRKDELRVFLEPAEWDDLQGSRPVIQLDVSIKHYIGLSATDGPHAVERSSLPCMSSFPTLFAIFSTHLLCIVGTVLWCISKPTPDPNVVRNNVAGARKRATYPLFLPRGVTSRRMKKFWHKLQFNPVAPVAVPFKAELFHSPPKNISLLRVLARKGRRGLEHSIRKQKGKPKRVQGIPDDAQLVAPLLALAHGPGLVQTVSGSNLDAIDNTTTTNFSENQEQPTRKARDSQTASPIDTSSQPSRTTEQTTQVHAAPKAKPFIQDTNATGSGDFILNTRSVHSGDMRSKDQR